MGPWANPALVSLWLLPLCSVASAGLHRLSCFQLISPEATPGLPKRLSVLRVNDLVLAAYNSNSGRLVPRNGYSPGDQEFWREIEAWYRAWDSWVETEYQVLVEEINASAPQAEPYYMQVLHTCEMNDATGAVRAITRYALNGEDVLRHESDQNRWFAVQPVAQPVAERWNQKGVSFDVMNVHTLGQCRAFIGLPALFTTQKTAQPTVHVALIPGTQDQSSRLVCHVTGFYPRTIEVTWKQGEWVAQGEQLRSRILPNADSTFQIQVSIELGQVGADPTEHVCVVRHSSLGNTPLKVTWDSQRMSQNVTTEFDGRFLLAALGVGTLVWYLRKKPARHHSRPYMAYIKREHEGKTYLCGGFLVAEDFVLTAAHCQGEVKSVTLGDYNSTDNGNRQTIGEIRNIPHPEFNRKTLNNDIMLLQLKTGVELNSWVRPIALPHSGETVKPGTLCSVAGWSKNKTELFAKRLREAHVKVLEDETCLRSPGWPCDYDPSTMLCVGLQETGQDLVLCDYVGGPLVCGGRAHGIVSCGSKDATQPMVCTRVAPFIPWIQETMRS